MLQNLICWLLPTSPVSHLDDVSNSGGPTRVHQALSPGAILGRMSLTRDLPAKGTSGGVSEGTIPMGSTRRRSAQPAPKTCPGLPDPFLLLIRILDPSSHISGNHLTAPCKPVISSALNPW